MAILTSTLFDGFMASAKRTGKMLVKRGVEIPETVEDFVSGFMGYGWKLLRRSGEWILEIDSLIVRKTMTVFELLIQKIRAVKGAMAITQGNGKVASVSITDTDILITIEDEMSFVEHDLILCQTFTGNSIKRYHVEISAIESGVIRIPRNEFPQDEYGELIPASMPEGGDDIVQFGNSSRLDKYKGRHSAIYLHSDESGQPAIDLLEDIYSKDWTGCIKTRIGGAIPGTTDKRGFYTVNGMIKGVDGDGGIMYYINPDGEASFAQKSALFKPDKSGHIAGGAIAWKWDALSGKYVTTMGDVILKWDNLSQETKDNLKGETGKNGLDGAAGVDGEDGVSIVWKGEFPSHPANPQNGWAYKNTTDRKSYVYQSNTWYQMTVDGINGQNGDDGISVVWKGEMKDPPENPQKNWVYRDTDNGVVYIFNGTAWALMTVDGDDGTDGTDGTDGLSVFITYHDSITIPATPTGNGTSGGWHTNTTDKVVWMSQKVSIDASSGLWGVPIKIRGMDGADANLLPWVEDWNTNLTQIGDEYVVSPKMFSGTKGTDGKLTGIAIGRECITIDGVKMTGIFALVNDEVVFEMDPINKKYKFKGDFYTPPLIITPINMGQYLIPWGTSGLVYLIDFEKTGLNIIFEDFNTTYAILGRLPQEEKYNGAEVSIFNASKNLSLGIVELGTLQGSGDTAKIIGEDYIFSTFGSLRCKCVVMNYFPAVFNDQFPNINGKTIAWFNIQYQP